ncbi:hypothetical protein ACFLYP_01765 [Chloroflexota bacterium]
MRIFQLQRLSAVALLVFMILHMVMMHYPPRHIEYSNIVAQMENPVWKFIEICFLFFVMLHALTGSYAVLLDYQRISKYKTMFAALLLVAGVVAFYWGAKTIMSWQPPI